MDNLIQSLIMASMQNMSRLPAGYLECKYCYTTSNNTYLDTGLMANANDVYECRVRKTSTTTNQSFIGDGNTKTDSNFAIWLSDMSNQTYAAEFSFGNGSTASYKVACAKSNDFSVAEWHTYKADLIAHKAYIDDEPVGTSSSTSAYANAKKLVLFGSWRGSNINDRFCGDIAECVFQRSGSEIRRFVPCIRLSDNVAGYYDLCGSSSPSTGTPFYTANTPSYLHAYLPTLDIDADANIAFTQEITTPETTISFTALTFSTPQYVSWGDGDLTLVDENTATVSHTYANAGTYNVKIQNIYTVSSLKFNGVTNGTLLRFNNATKIAAETFFYVPLVIRDNVLPNEITSIGVEAFRQSSIQCSSLPSALTTIGKRAFIGSYGLTISELPSGVTSISTECFNACRGITSMTFHAGITEINTGAFKSCDSLSTVTFLGTPTLIADTAFSRCSALTDIYVPWSEGAVANAPWGATNATIHYNHTS